MTGPFEACVGRCARCSSIRHPAAGSANRPKARASHALSCPVLLTRGWGFGPDLSYISWNLWLPTTSACPSRLRLLVATQRIHAWHRVRCHCRYCDRRTSRPGLARSAGGPGVTAALSCFGGVAQVFDYFAGRLDDAAGGPGQGKAGLDRDPLTRRGIAACRSSTTSVPRSRVSQPAASTTARVARPWPCQDGATLRTSSIVPGPPQTNPTMPTGSGLWAIVTRSAGPL